MRGLKICLWISAFACLLAVFSLFMPVSTLGSFAKLFGVESLPDVPLFRYAVRNISATSIVLGLFFIILALNPMKYGVLVPGSGLAFIFIGIVCMITGPVVKMPTLWFLGDSLSCLVLGILILVFWQRAKCKVMVKEENE
jgi:hypothetical protein